MDIISILYVPTPSAASKHQQVCIHFSDSLFHSSKRVLFAFDLTSCSVVSVLDWIPLIRDFENALCVEVDRSIELYCA